MLDVSWDRDEEEEMLTRTGKWPFIRRKFRHWPDDGLTWDEMHREDEDDE